jgi:hypothetical protein
VWASRCPGALAQAARLCWTLDALITRDPWREICVIARTAEHDAVVIPDLSPAFYPPSPELGRALYVAATRARDWLWILTLRGIAHK